MLTKISAITGLTADLRALGPSLATRWTEVHEIFLHWVTNPGLRADLRSFVRARPGAELAALSRETTTHFAWCLLDQPDLEFTLWLHEYKPHRDWRAGYADSVHNHRYHFSTVLLQGSYLHEEYDATVREGMITSVTLRNRVRCTAGTALLMPSSDFHRIPRAADDTLTFLIKSRPVTEWSLSYDLEQGTGHRHVPIENRVPEFTARI